MVDAPDTQPGEPTERLQEIQQRLEAATPGPWRWSEDGPDDKYARVSGGNRDDSLDTVEDQGYLTQANAALIAHAPGDLSYLLGEVASLRQQNAELRAQVASLTQRLQTTEVVLSDALITMRNYYHGAISRGRVDEFVGKHSAYLRASLVPGEKEVPR